VAQKFRIEDLLEENLEGRLKKLGLQNESHSREVQSLKLTWASLRCKDRIEDYKKTGVLRQKEKCHSESAVRKRSTPDSLRDLEVNMTGG